MSTPAKPALISKLRYMGRQYAAGQQSRGGDTGKHYLEDAADELERLNAAVAEARAVPEPSRPDLLERLSYHALERDDLTIDDCLDVLRDGWKRVHGRTERQMVLQLLALLSAAPAPTEPAMLNGLTEDETAATASVAGLSSAEPAMPAGPDGHLAPASEGSPGGAVVELPDRIRVPLHRLWADAGYLIGRARNGETDLAVHTIKALCDELERAIRAALAQSAQAAMPAERVALSEADKEAINSIAHEYACLMDRWREARAGSQEIANLHATFKDRERRLGKLAESGLFSRVADALGITPAQGKECVFLTCKQKGVIAGDGKPCPNDHDPDCRWPDCNCRNREQG